ncbi:MAG: Trm112 family protein [Acidobacteria bacterium]|nr:Trm112 family protein [Acidobacteriota bacterium]
MPVPKELLEILACPLCREEVQPTQDGDGLKCVKCGRVYPVRDDIPIMLAEEAAVNNHE